MLKCYGLEVYPIMRKKLFTGILCAGLLTACVMHPVSAEDLMVADSEEDTDQAVPAQTEGSGSGLISADGLFEVVSETQSRAGKKLEDVVPKPREIEVPQTPPSSSLTVETLDSFPDPAEAMLLYQEEYEKAQIRYHSDKLFYTCTEKETENGSYFLTHVIIRDAGQLRGEDSFGDFAGTRETPQDAAKRTGAKILINGSYFDYGTGFATGGELLIRDNKVLHGPYSDGYEICLRKDGTLFSPGYNTISSVLKQDVVFSWGTCEDLLIRNGKKMELTDYDWNGYSYPRTAIGMVRPLEYYIITAGKADYEQGITIYEEQEIFADLKCAYARGLDGGGSSALVIDGEYVNENGDRLEDGTLQRRAAADFLLFTE